VSEPSAKAASILLDILGAETFADDAVAYIVSHMASPVDDEHVLFLKLGAVRAAQIVADEVRAFADRT
jgi:hypothetical protein